MCIAAQRYLRTPLSYKMSHWGKKPKSFDHKFQDKVHPILPCFISAKKLAMKAKAMKEISPVERDTMRMMCPPYRPYFGGPKPTYFVKEKVEEVEEVIPERYPTFERKDLKPCPGRFFPPCEDTREMYYNRAPAKKKGCMFTLQMPYSQYHEG